MNKIQEKVLSNILFSEELTKAKELFSESVSNEDLLNYLIDDAKIILVVDWSGEDSEKQIGLFLQSRLNQINKNLCLNQEQVYIDMEKKIKKGEIERGDSVQFILSHFQKFLKKENFNIMLIDFGNDSYYIVLTSNESEKALKKFKDDYWNFKTFGRGRGEILYIVNCTCGSQNIWQLKRTEPSPTNEYCDKCGRMLFEKDGSALIPVEKEYI